MKQEIIDKIEADLDRIYRETHRTKDENHAVGTINSATGEASHAEGDDTYAWQMTEDDKEYLIAQSMKAMSDRDEEVHTSALNSYMRTIDLDPETGHVNLRNRPYHGYDYMIYDPKRTMTVHYRPWMDKDSWGYEDED